MFKNHIDDHDNTKKVGRNVVDSDENFYLICVSRIGTCDLDHYDICHTFDEILDSVKSFARQYCILNIREISIIGIGPGLMCKFCIDENFFDDIDDAKHLTFDCCKKKNNGKKDFVDMLNEKCYKRKNLKGNPSNYVSDYLYKVIERNEIDDNDEFNTIGSNEKLFKIFRKQWIFEALMDFIFREYHTNSNPQTVIKYYLILTKLLTEKYFMKKYHVYRHGMLKKEVH